MSHKHYSNRLRGHVFATSQRGSALVIGIFVITVMFLLAATLTRVMNDADEQVNLEVWGVRALATANSGADVAMARLFPVDGSAGVCTASSSWTPTANLVGFHGCVNVALTCNSFVVDGVTQYRITSSATCSSGKCDSGATDSTTCLRVNRTVEVEARAE